MELTELNRLLESYIQRNPLPALLAGVTFGAFLCLLALQAIRRVRRRQSLGPAGRKARLNRCPIGNRT